MVFAAGYTYYYLSGARTIVSSASGAKAYFEQAMKKGQDKAPAPNEALQWLRETATSYAAFIPGAKSYVDSAFNDLDMVQKKHGPEVDNIVKDAYHELKGVTQSKKDMFSIETLSEAWQILQKHIKRIGELAGDVSGDILKQHPELKEKFGGNIDQLQKMADQYGPEAKKQVEETWGQVQGVLRGGFSAANIDKARKLIEEKVEQVKKMGDQAWQKGMEQAKPYLDKSPKVKELVEKNKDKLQSGDLGQLWQMVQEAAKTGKTEDLEKYIKDTAGKAQDSMSGGMEQLFKMVPGGDEIVPKLRQLQELAQKHGKEAENLMRDALQEVKDVLQKKADEGQKLAEKAQKDAKS